MHIVARICAILVLAIPWHAHAMEKFDPLPAHGMRIAFAPCIPLPALAIQVLIGNCLVDSPFTAVIYDAQRDQLTLVHWTTIKMSLTHDIREAIDRLLPERNRGISVRLAPQFPDFRGKALPLPRNPEPLTFAAMQKD